MSAKLDSMLLSSPDPERLAGWYVSALQPDNDTKMDPYRILTFGGFHVLFDRRADVAGRNPQPGRMILNFDVSDARAAVERIDGLGAEWLAPLEDREGSLFATAIDPDGNYVQLIELSEADYYNEMVGFDDKDAGSIPGLDHEVFVAVLDISIQALTGARAHVEGERASAEGTQHRIARAAVAAEAKVEQRDRTDLEGLLHRERPEAKFDVCA